MAGAVPRDGVAAIDSNVTFAATSQNACDADTERHRASGFPHAYRSDTPSTSRRPHVIHSDGARMKCRLLLIVCSAPVAPSCLQDVSDGELKAVKELRARTHVIVPKYERQVGR
jgi:hypothetical protein